MEWIADVFTIVVTIVTSRKEMSCVENYIAVKVSACKYNVKYFPLAMFPLSHILKWRWNFISRGIAIFPKLYTKNRHTLIKSSLHMLKSTET